MNFYFTIIGCTPKNRTTEQHDVFFGMANQFKDLVPSINNFWPECEGRFHIDSWRKVEFIDNYKIEVVNKGSYSGKEKIFFINLGGYLPNDMEEYHYKTLLVAKTKSEAIKKVKGIKVMVTGMSTQMEANSIQVILKAIEFAHRSLKDKGIPRIISSIRIDERFDKSETLEDRAKSVQEKLDS